MIPSVLARHIEQGVKGFLRTTFPATNPFFADLLERFLAEPGKLFKGPYLDVHLPFHPGKRRVDYFPALPLPFIAHQHQEQSFARLIGPKPRSTIISTGIGPGSGYGPGQFCRLRGLYQCPSPVVVRGWNYRWI